MLAVLTRPAAAQRQDPFSDGPTLWSGQKDTDALLKFLAQKRKIEVPSDWQGQTRLLSDHYWTLVSVHATIAEDIRRLKDLVRDDPDENAPLVKSQLARLQTRIDEIKKSGWNRVVDALLVLVPRYADELRTMSMDPKGMVQNLLDLGDRTSACR